MALPVSNTFVTCIVIFGRANLLSDGLISIVEVFPYYKYIGDISRVRTPIRIPVIVSLVIFTIWPHHENTPV